MQAEPTLGSRFARLTFINILSNLTVPLAGLVDTAMLGHLPDIRFLAGVALGSVLFDYVYWGFGFLRMGTTGTTAQAVGRDDEREVYTVLYRAGTLALAIAALLLILQRPLRDVGFLLLSGAPGVESAGKAYFDARIWGAPATLVNFVLIGWYLGRARSRDVLWMTIAANAANVALNYVFIMRLGLAAYGAGLATMAAQYAMLATGLTILARDGRPVPFVPRAVLSRDRLGALLRLNVDILVRTVCLVSAFAVFTNFSSRLGTTTLAANSLLIRAVYLSAYLVDGVAFACESLAGIYYGARDRARLRRLVRLALLTGLGFAAGSLVVFLVRPRLWLGALTSHAAVTSHAEAHVAWLVPTVMFGAVAFVYDGLFLGLTDGRTLRNTMLFSLLVAFLPLAWYAVTHGRNELLWAAFALFMVSRAASLGLAARGLLHEDARIS